MKLNFRPNMKTPSLPAWIALSLIVTAAGCSSVKVDPRVTLVPLAPACSPAQGTDFGFVREDPESDFALKQAGIVVGSFSAGAAAGALGTVAGAAALPVAVVGLALAQNANVNKELRRHAGTMLRLTVAEPVRGGKDRSDIRRFWDIPRSDMPSADLLDTELNIVRFTNGGGVYARKDMGIEAGDIVDVVQVFGRMAEARPIWASLSYGPSDFNRLLPRVTRVVCKHGDEACLKQADHEITGILCRHTQTEFGPDAVLIDPVKLEIDKKQREADNVWADPT